MTDVKHDSPFRVLKPNGISPPRPPCNRMGFITAMIEVEKVFNRSRMARHELFEEKKQQRHLYLNVGVLQ